MRAIRRRREQDREAKSEGEGLRKNDLRYRVAQEGEGEEYDEDEMEDEDEIMGELDEDGKRKEDGEEGEEEEEEDEKETNYYKENIFNKEDYFLYRGVMNFYSGDYDKSISDFEQSSSLMHSSKVLYPHPQFPDDPSSDNVSQASSQTDLSDVGLCSLNIHEYSFNTVLNLLMLREWKKALTKVDYILDTIPKKYAPQLWLIRALLNQYLGHSPAAKKDFKRAYKYDTENTQKYVD